ncbi:sugar transferase [Clostridium thermarum]|uniref:sugar transferase n=1 Tax=Clostridium thermarum TaxID=1716543 RepID=UPI0013D1D61E|nr:sugar transferase [Clostridium thermarum]
MKELQAAKKFNIQGKLSFSEDISMYNLVKRVLDIIGGVVGLVLFSPLILIVAIIIKLDSKGPAIFGHNRLGKNGKIIKVYKFRSMVHNADELLKNLSEKEKKEFEKNFKLENDPRITRVGGFLRKTSIDELPQFFNVLIGNMTLVGPRPIVEKELEKYGEYKDKLLSVKPGLTGNWQVSGRSDTTYEERVMLDMEYIDKRSIWNDIKIMIKTVYVVLAKKGAK